MEEQEIIETPATTSPPLPLKTQKRSLLIALGLLIILSGAVFAGIQIGKRQTPNTPGEILFNQPTTVPVTPTPDLTAGWKTYTSSEKRYSIKYPGSYIPKETNGILSFYDSLIGKNRLEIYPDFVGGWGCVIGISSEKLTVGGEEGKLDILSSATGENNCTTEDSSVKFYSAKLIIQPKGIIWYFGFEVEKTKKEEDLTTFKQILSTFKFTEIPVSPTPVIKPKVINYSVPQGWVTINDKTNFFSLAYDPSLYSPQTFDLRIDLISKKCCSHIFNKVLDYNGGSRHNFIKTNIGYDVLSKTYEKEYLVGGKSALIIYDVDASGSSTVGAIVINPSKAILLESQTIDQSLIEQILATFKFLE